MAELRPTIRLLSEVEVLITYQFIHRCAAAALTLGLSVACFGATKVAAMVPTPKIGTNLSAVVDYTREWPFVNVFKVARPWISQQQGLPWGTGFPLRLTTDGYPARLLPGQFAETLIYDNSLGGKASYPTGQYTLLYEGEGTIKFDAGTASIVSQKVGRMVVNVPVAQNGIYLIISMTNPANPLRNIRLIAPGYESTYNTAPFHPLFLKTLKSYQVLRFMEWMQTNTTKIANWADRPQVTDYSYSWRGVPLETMIDLANTTGTAPWFNIPHAATDDYVRQFALLVKTRLNPSLKFYVEYSNETWNSIFTQAAYVQGKGLAMSLSLDPPTAGAQYTGIRAAQIFTIFKSVFGDTTRFTRVIASQAANPWLQEQSLAAKNAYASTDALAIAPYFSDCSDSSIGGWGILGDALTAVQVDAMSISNVLTAEDEHIQNCALAEMTAAAKTAAKYKVKLVAYESGQSLAASGGAQSDSAMTALFTAANRDAGMGTLYDHYLQNWKTSGGDLILHFTDVNAFTQYGSWGSLEYQDQDVTTAPKYQALMRYAAANVTTTAKK